MTTTFSRTKNQVNGKQLKREVSANPAIGANIVHLNFNEPSSLVVEMDDALDGAQELALYQTIDDHVAEEEVYRNVISKMNFITSDLRLEEIIYRKLGHYTWRIVNNQATTAIALTVNATIPDGQTLSVRTFCDCGCGEISSNTISNSGIHEVLIDHSRA